MIARNHSAAKSLIVFSDDWGRHPSSCQHLVRRLLPEYEVLWVNTIGTRAPRLDAATMKRVGEKLKQWTSTEEASGEPSEVEVSAHENLTVVNPRMWPWFCRRHDRTLNSWLLSKQLKPLIKAMPQPVTAITTLPITADLPGLLPVQKWLYYCVDDFGEWPGLDGDTLRRMDVEMIRTADEIVAVSDHLRNFIHENDCISSLLTHGVDLQHWQTTANSDEVNDRLDGIDGPLVVFWGVVDRRLDSDMLTLLSNRLKTGAILLVGPQQDPDPAILDLPNVHTPGPMRFDQLPSLAQRSSVLIMPYADLPVTRAMQPLKMKEYLATGRPVVVSSLPAVEAWQDCMDVTQTPEDFASAVIKRIETDITQQQQTARTRLKNEGWDAKARQLQKSL